MSANEKAPIIIKKKKVVGGDGHHGGAWKVAYADFVTAMMAFFLLMWLLNATTEKQRKGIADYFNPTIPINRVSGGGDGAFNGDSVFTEDSLAQNGTGAAHELSNVSEQVDESEKKAAEDAAFSDIEKTLNAFSGESMSADRALRHIVTRVTDEGLIIEIFDLDEAMLFANRSAEENPRLDDIIDVVFRAVSIVKNDIAIAGYVRTQPVVIKDNSVWELSAQRADRVRALFKERDMDADRIQRITGYADGKPSALNPLSVRNNRIEIILLRDP